MSQVRWTENDTTRIAHWRSANHSPAPDRIVTIDDDTTANEALRLALSGVGLLWRGDFHNARQLMRAMDRRLEKRARPKPKPHDLGSLFHAQRRARAERAVVLGRLLVALEPDRSIQLRRAPDVRAACEHAYGDPDTAADQDADEATLVSLPELLGVISAYQWHRQGIDIPALESRIYPAYGVFAPTRNEYINLVAAARLPHGAKHCVAFDIGTGTGVLAALLARRGIGTVLASDINPRAVTCADQNMRHLGLDGRVRVSRADLWPDRPQRADLIVCNPPWLPGKPTSDLELGIYDPASDMLTRFLHGLPDRLTPDGQGWLVLSDLAEHLGLRTRDTLAAHIRAAGLQVLGKQQTAARHSRAAETSDPLHLARAQERTVLWRLGRMDAR